MDYANKQYLKRKTESQLTGDNVTRALVALTALLGVIEFVAELFK